MSVMDVLVAHLLSEGRAVPNPILTAVSPGIRASFDRRSPEAPAPGPDFSQDVFDRAIAGEADVPFVLNLIANETRLQAV